MDEDELHHTSHDEDHDEPAPWAQQLGLESSRVHVMQATLFRMPELARANATESSNTLKHPRSPNMRAELKEIPQRTSFAQPRTQPPARKYTRVSSSASVAASHEGAYMDAGLSLGRSFRVGWGAGDRLVHVGDLSSSSPSYVRVQVSESSRYRRSNECHACCITVTMARTHRA